MRPTKGLSSEQLNEDIRAMKVEAFDMAKQLFANPAMIKNTGHKHWAEPIEYAVKRIEARIQDWERNNP